jgi:hypothetical protein
VDGGDEHELAGGPQRSYLSSEADDAGYALKYSRMEAGNGAPFWDMKVSCSSCSALAQMGAEALMNDRNRGVGGRPHQ